MAFTGTALTLRISVGVSYELATVSTCVSCWGVSNSSRSDSLLSSAVGKSGSGTP